MAMMLIDQTKDSACKTAEADAIREKTGGSAQLAYDWANNKGFADAIAAIPSGETVYYTPKGIAYTKNTVNPAASLLAVQNLYDSANDLETIEFPNYAGVPTNYTFVNCANLKSIRFLGSMKPANSNFVRYSVASKLEEVQLGSEGHPVISTANWGTYMFGFFSGGKKPTITVYVDAETLADVPTTIKNYQPWGATGSTIVYRSSNTGEVLS